MPASLRHAPSRAYAGPREPFVLRAMVRSRSPIGVMCVCSARCRQGVCEWAGGGGSAWLTSVACQAYRRVRARCIRQAYRRVRARCIRMRFCSTTAHGSPRVPHRRWSHPHPMRCVCLVSTCSPATLRHAPSRAYAAAGPREPFVLRASFPSRVRAVSNFGRLMLRVFSIIVWRNLFFTAVVTGDRGLGVFTDENGNSFCRSGSRERARMI